MVDKSAKSDSKFLTVLGLLQLFCFLYLATVADYANATSSSGEGTVSKYYAMYQDIHVMIFVGFGLLMTFLKKNGFNSMGMTFLIGVMSIQFGIVMVNLIHAIGDGHKPELIFDIPTLICGDFAAGAVLISFGAVLGRVTPAQILVMLTFEIVFYALNEYIGYVQFEAVDMGGSMFVHTFGAYFGLAVSWVLQPPKETENEESSYTSDIFAMVGTVFLWMFWPSFNGALAGEDFHSQERVVINTVLSLCCSCSTTFFFSHYYLGKLDMVHIQNATLAGGVAVGSSSDLVIGPYGAIITGIVAGFVSTTGYVYLTPYLNRMGIYDVCGVHNLHGMPGVIGGIAGSIAAGMATGNIYGNNVSAIFPARDTRSAQDQAVFQFCTLLLTLAMAIVGGVITGYVLTLFEEKENLYCDIDEWEVDQEVGEAAKLMKLEKVQGNSGEIELAKLAMEHEAVV